MSWVVSPSFSENIVTSGLIQRLDAGIVASYPGTGTTWTDISGNGNNGTLTGGVTFDSANKGSLVFNGTNGYISTALTPPNQNYTISILFNPTSFSGANRGFFSTYAPSVFNGAYIGIFNTSGNTTLYYNSNGFIAIGRSISLGQWAQLTFINSSNQLSVYLNSDLVASVSGATTHAAPLFIGRTRFNSDYWDGKISSFMVYNRALSAAEVSQNFNVLRLRYEV
jgi:hypothetical protein